MPQISHISLDKFANISRSIKSQPRCEVGIQNSQLAVMYGGRYETCDSIDLSRGHEITPLVVVRVAKERHLFSYSLNMSILLSRRQAIAKSELVEYVAFMSDELKSERVQLMMTPSEVKAIDDWSFENRVRGRAEAIRRLIEAGLRALSEE
ncbi:hypothetical protein CGLAMM_02855 [Acetobacteraceae bacterium EV16G]|uniref:Uncharacterized protein n=2 Tax=Sorlinia euscelidii TaxID=3081148 RepID=A0ABU7U0Z7_9PROT